MNNVVQRRIRECRIVHLVVSPTSEAVQVNEHVFAELLLILECDLCDQRQHLYKHQIYH